MRVLEDFFIHRRGAETAEIFSDEFPLCPLRLCGEISLSTVSQKSMSVFTSSCRQSFGRHPVSFVDSGLRTAGMTTQVLDTQLCGDVLARHLGCQRAQAAGRLVSFQRSGVVAWSSQRLFSSNSISANGSARTRSSSAKAAEKNHLPSDRMKTSRVLAAGSTSHR